MASTRRQHAWSPGWTRVRRGSSRERKRPERNRVQSRVPSHVRSRAPNRVRSLGHSRVPSRVLSRVRALRSVAAVAVVVGVADTTAAAAADAGHRSS
jgi:hypothetical protein